MAFGVIGVEQGFGCTITGDQRQFPAEIDRILDADAHAEAAGRIVDMGGIPRQQHSPPAIGFGLAGHVGEAGDIAGIIDAIFGAVLGAECGTQRVDGDGTGADADFSDHDGELAGLVLADGVGTDGVGEKAELWFTRHVGFGQQVADGRIGAGETDAGLFADEAAAAIAADEIGGAQTGAIAERNGDPGVVLSQAGDFDAVQHGHSQRVGPVAEEAFSVLLRQRQTIGMAGGKGADIEPRAGKADDLHGCTGSQKAFGQATLIEDFDAASMQAEGAGLDAFADGTLFDDQRGETGKAQFGGEHQPGGAGAGDNDWLVDHEEPPYAMGPLL